MRKILALFICVMLIGIVGINTIYAASCDILVNSLPENERISFLKSIEWRPVDDSYRNSIVGFDVTECGIYALAVNGDAVYVYDQSHELVYGYGFRSDGDFGISFQGENLAIYFLRGSTIVILDCSGNCIDVQKPIDSIPYISFMKELLNRTCKDVGEKTYLLERNANIGNSFSRFVLEEYGERTVLYDVSKEHNIRQILILASPICFFTFVIFGISKRNKK